jgi:hypothetical protein
MQNTEKNTTQPEFSKKEIIHHLMQICLGNKNVQVMQSVLLALLDKMPKY